MPNSIVPTQIGYTPETNQLPSQVIMGRDVNVEWEGIGLGQNGRPDMMTNLIINISSASADNTLLAKITISADDLIALAPLSENSVTAALTFKVREVRVCEDTDNDGLADTEKCMLVLASQTYLPKAV